MIFNGDDMKKIIKKTFAVFCICITAFGFSACQKKETETTVKETATVEEAFDKMPDETIAESQSKTTAISRYIDEQTRKKIESTLFEHCDNLGIKHKLVSANAKVSGTKSSMNCSAEYYEEELQIYIDYITGKALKENVKLITFQWADAGGQYYLFMYS